MFSLKHSHVHLEVLLVLLLLGMQVQGPGSWCRRVTSKTRRASGVVASRPLCVRKAEGAQPAESTLFPGTQDLARGVVRKRQLFGVQYLK